ncbi:hypothetical protein MTR67_026680 [Solanum verrucosum]|uniref:Uncharacterized protein n=1 Tax=Solanum verrucosum TaxID=315347 RepID=A0AAF0TZA5_SOLVR|nr:hypothetical protein MTR67_026680 [Solanum verrucosum]
MQNGNVISLSSRQLKKNEKNYLTHDLVLSAVIHCLMIWGGSKYGLYYRFALFPIEV